ncbi:MAG: hypothetical protein ACKOZY_10590 [Flavobacteriales bacterium]
MKGNRLYYVLPLLILWYGCKSISERAAEYNSRIVSVHQAAVMRLAALDSALMMDGASDSLLMSELHELDSVVESGLKQSEEVGPFEGDVKLQMELFDWLTTHRQFLHNDYKKLIQIKLLPLDSVQVSDSDSSLVIQERIRAQSRVAQDALVNAQNEFGRLYHLKFE